MKKTEEFIIIDDDETVHLLCGMIIKHALGSDTEIKTFTLADDGINYLKECNKKSDFKTLLFLDINMSVTTGWDALSMLEKLDDSTKKQLTVFMLSSSIDPNDKKRAMQYPLVLDFVEKPLTVKKIEALLIGLGCKKK